MAIQEINVSTGPNTGNGDPIRAAFVKINQNFTTPANAASRMVGTQAGNVMEVGAFGLGGLSSLATQPNDVRQSGFFHTYNDNNMAYCAFLNIMHSELDAYAWQLGTAMGATTLNNLRARIRTGSGWSSEAKIWNQHNTTVDSNGFIKAASPIVKLFADKIELNDEAGQQNISFEKLDVGNYLIKGSSGFAQEGWYIETPKDANGNLLVAVVYEQLANGDISVKTYDYMLNKKGRIVADTETPLDIPETRWIDLRLQELPQPEIEVTDDPEQ